MKSTSSRLMNLQQVTSAIKTARASGATAPSDDPSRDHAAKTVHFQI